MGRGPGAARGETLRPQLAGLMLPTLQLHAWPKRQQSSLRQLPGRRRDPLPLQAASLQVRRGGRRGLRFFPAPAALRELAWGASPPAPRKPPLHGWSPGQPPSDPGAAGALFPLSLRDPAVHRMLETVKPSPSLPPLAALGKDPRAPAAAKCPRSPSATRSSRACSSSGGRYPRAPSRFRCSISRWGRGGGGGPGAERRRQRGLGSR